MNKKQTGIIVTLVLLIGFCGYLATKVNGPLYVNDSDFIGDKTAVVLNDDSKTTSASFFTEAQMTRDTSKNKYMQDLKLIIDDEKTPEKEKTTAREEYKQVSLNLSKSTDIELKLKAQGFDEAYCSVEKDKVDIVVKGQSLTEKQRKIIQDIVIDATGIKDVDIKSKE